MRGRAILILAALLLGLAPQAPAQLIVAAGQTVVVVESSGHSSEPAANALLMWGFQGPATTPAHVVSSDVPYFAGGTNATAEQVAQAAERVREAAGGSADIEANLVRTLGAPEYLGKITLALKRPTASEIERILDGVAAEQSTKEPALRAVGVWFRPVSSCEDLAKRANVEAQANAMSDIAAIGRAFGMQPGKRAMSQERAIQVAPSAFLCNNAVPKLPLNIMESPAQLASGSFVMKSARVVAYAMSVRPGATPHEAQAVAEVQYGFGPSFVQLHLPVAGVAISSTGAAAARVNSEATLVAISTYDARNRAVTNALRAQGYDAASVDEEAGARSLIGIVVRGTDDAVIEKVATSLRAAATMHGVAFTEAVQAVPFARACSSERDAALEKASTIAQENDFHLAALAGRHPVRPVAIIEEHAWQDVICGPIPNDAIQAFQRLERRTDYTYIPTSFDRIHVAVKVVYEAR